MLNPCIIHGISTHLRYTRHLNKWNRAVINLLYVWKIKFKGILINKMSRPRGLLLQILRYVKLSQAKPQLLIKFSGFFFTEIFFCLGLIPFKIYMQWCMGWKLCTIPIACIIAYKQSKGRFQKHNFLSYKYFWICTKFNDSLSKYSYETKRHVLRQKRPE